MACLVAALALPTGVAGAQVPEPEPDDVPPGGLPDVTVPQLVWEPCGDGAECTTAEVPVDYADPKGRTLELAVARRPADDQANRIGSLFVNFGGPGGTAAEVVAAFGDLLFPEEVLARFDIVGVDPRGVGQSTPVRCFASTEEQLNFFSAVPPFPVAPREVARQIAWDTELSARCGAANGDLLDHVSTTAVARDLDVLRAAVGDEKLTYVGLSYGTYLGAVYANLFPQRVRAQVLDGVLDPVDFVTGPRGTISSARIESDEGAYATLLQFFRTCTEAGERCAFSAGDPKAKYDELAARLRQQPVTLETPEGPVSVTYAVLVSATLSTLYAPVTWPDFAAALQELYDALPAGVGPGTAYARFQARLADARTRSSQEDYDNVPESFLAVTCAETDNPRNPLRWATTARVRDRVAPYFGARWTWATSPCATWPGRAADRHTGPWTARTANPVLIVNPRFDPATNYSAAVKLDNLLPNSTLLTLDGYGHTSTLSSCIDAAVTTYLVSVATPPAGTVCQQDVGPFDPLPVEAEARAEAEAVLAIAAAPEPLVPSD